MFGEKSLNVRPAVIGAKRPGCPAKCRFEISSAEVAFNEGARRSGRSSRARWGRIRPAKRARSFSRPWRPKAVLVRFAQDDTGTEFPSIDAAERETAECAGSIGRDLLPTGVARSVTVEVRNMHGQRIVTATVILAVDRVNPEPTP